jgi:SAM-dependent methyltransferase
MGRLFPPPEPAVLAALYGSDYDAYRGDASLAARSARERLKMLVARLRAAGRKSDGLASAWALNGVAKLIELGAARSVPLTASVPLALPKTAAILDYGCGAGFWLSAMSLAGYSNLYAYDVEQPALAKLEGLGVRCFAADPSALPLGTFDCIRLEHVLEHLVDPRQELACLKERLAPGGSIVLTVPNYGSSSAAELGGRWKGLKLPHHLSHFTAPAVQQLAGAAGLQIRDVRFLAISEVALPRAPGGALSRRLQQWRYHARVSDRPTADFLGLELVPVP